MTARTTSQPFLIIQIPCLNEEHTLPQTIADLPARIDGIGKIEYLVIDDGSTDRTAEVAKNLKVHHLIKNQTTIGLARSFRKGLDSCLALGADIIVNTDGDNQYSGMDIAKLVVPIIEDRAEIVVGDRNTADMEHFSVFKRLLQKIGSAAVRRLSGLDIPDAVSGFRAISRAAALQLNIVSSFSYTTEMLIQAGNKKLSVVSVPIKTNSVTRKSRLFRSIPQFLQRQMTTMIRMYSMYRPLRVFFWLGLLLIMIGGIPIVRFIYFYLSGDAAGHIQSLVLGGALLSMGFITLLVGMMSDLINFNRQLLEISLEKIRKIELQLDNGKDESTTPKSR